MKKNNLLKNSVYKILPLESLLTADYQKDRLDVRRAKAIAKEYDPVKAGCVLISEREGKFYIADGQHRTAAAKIAGETHIMCQVVAGLTYEEEARLFAEQSKLTRGVSKTIKFKALLEAKDEKSMQINDTIKAAGFGICYKGGNVDNKIKALLTVERVYDKIGQPGLLRCLSLLKKTWNGDVQSVNTNIIKGVGELISKYGYNLGDDIFAKQLQKIKPTSIIAEASSAAYYNDSKAAAYAKVLLIHYNKNLRSNKLSWEI